jgi:hypothetical protein
VIPFDFTYRLPILPSCWCLTRDASSSIFGPLLREFPSLHQPFGTSI